MQDLREKFRVKIRKQKYEYKLQVIRNQFQNTQTHDYQQFENNLNIIYNEEIIKHNANFQNYLDQIFKLIQQKDQLQIQNNLSDYLNQNYEKFVKIEPYLSNNLVDSMMILFELFKSNQNYLLLIIDFEKIIMQNLKNFQINTYVLLLINLGIQNAELSKQFLLFDKKILNSLLQLKKEQQYTQQDNIIKDNSILNIIKSLISHIEPQFIEDLSNLMYLQSLSLNIENPTNYDLFFEILNLMLSKNFEISDGYFQHDQFIHNLIDLFCKKEKKFQHLFLDFILKLQQEINYFKTMKPVQEKLFNLLLNESYNTINYNIIIQKTQNCILNIIKSNNKYIVFIRITQIINKLDFSNFSNYLIEIILLIIEYQQQLNYDIPSVELLKYFLRNLKEIEYIRQSQFYLEIEDKQDIIIQILYSIYNILENCKIKDQIQYQNLRQIFEENGGHEIMEYWLQNGCKQSFKVAEQIVDDFFHI